MTEMNSIVRRIDKLTTTLKPESEVQFVCVWGDEETLIDCEREIVTTWGGGRLSDGDDQERLELEEDYHD